MITSNTGTVVDNTVEYEYKYQGTAKGIGVVSYINYEAGIGDNVYFKIKYREKSLGENYYYDCMRDEGKLIINNFSFAGSGKYRFPIPISYNEDYMILEFYGLVSGTIDIEFSVDSTYH